MSYALIDEPLKLSDADTTLASDAARALARVPSDARSLAVHFGDDAVVLPGSVVRLLGRVLAELANGRAVTVVPVDTELTTQQAADLLNVSRPFVVHLLELGDMPHRKVGSRRRVRLNDVLDYKERSTKRSREALAELARESQALELP